MVLYLVTIMSSSRIFSKIIIISYPCKKVIRVKNLVYNGLKKGILTLNSFTEALLLVAEGIIVSPHLNLNLVTGCTRDLISNQSYIGIFLVQMQSFEDVWLPQPPTALSSAQKLSLISAISEKEVIYALQSMNPNKSARLDGFSVSFFQDFWHIVGNDVV